MATSSTIPAAARWQARKLSVTGTIAYVDARQALRSRHELQRELPGVAVGKKSGDGVVFNLKEQEHRR